MELENRVVRLERQNKLFKRGIALAVVAALSLLVMGQRRRPRVYTVLRAKLFAVVDNRGKTVALVGRNPRGGNGIIVLKNKNQGFGVTLTGGAGRGGAIATFNQYGKRMSRLGSSPDGSTGVAHLFNAQGKRQLEISGSVATGLGTVYSFDSSGNLAQKWPSDSKDEGIDTKAKQEKKPQDMGLFPKANQ